MAASTYIGHFRIDRPWATGRGPQLADQYDVYPQSCFLLRSRISTHSSYAEAVRHVNELMAAEA